jgi:uncharacterized membrane protein (UPF0127 family)
MKLDLNGRETQRLCARAIALNLCALFLVCGTGCRSSAGGPTVGVRIGQKSFQLEVARTEPELEKGLMERDGMPDDHGMLFVFSNESVVNFWMKNTRFPLDILYLDHADKVVSIHQMKPYDLTPISSDYPAQYAIELNLGAADGAGVHVGDVVALPPSATGH